MFVSAEELKRLKQKAIADVSASGWCDGLKLTKVIPRNDGSVTFRFTADYFNDEILDED